MLVEFVSFGPGVRGCGATTDAVGLVEWAMSTAQPSDFSAAAFHVKRPTTEPWSNASAGGQAPRHWSRTVGRLVGFVRALSCAVSRLCKMSGPAASELTYGAASELGRAFAAGP
jgi:hypothetical protein